jgi:hypothetical protein
MNKYNREIISTPHSLVSNGKFNFGTFNKPFNILNPLDADCFAIPLPKIIKNLRLKEWQAYEMGNNDYFVFTVLYKAKSIALAQFLIYDKIKKKKYLYEKIIPTWCIKLPSSLSSSSGEYQDKNLYIQYNNNITSGNLNIKIKMNGFKELPDSEAEFNGLYNFTKHEPLVVSMPFSKRKGMYSHKSLMPMTGHLTIGKIKVDFNEKESFMIIDDHKGYYPYSSYYDWVTGIKSDGKGNLTGFNLTHNQVINKEQYNENCIWVKGKVYPLPPVKFSRPEGPDMEWSIKDEYGTIDIRFAPEVQGKVDVNLLFLKTYYRGPLGQFYGFITDSSGRKHSVDNFFGMGEEKRLRM